MDFGPISDLHNFFPVTESSPSNLTAASLDPQASSGAARVLGTLVTGVLLSLVIIVTLVGNSLVCGAVVSFRRLRSSVTNYFVVSLAVADLTVALLVMPYAVEVRLSLIICVFVTSYYHVIS